MHALLGAPSTSGGLVVSLVDGSVQDELTGIEARVRRLGGLDALPRAEADPLRRLVDEARHEAALLHDADAAGGHGLAVQERAQAEEDAKDLEQHCIVFTCLLWW